VRITHRLTDSPACVVVDNYDMGLQMQRMLQAAGQDVPASQPIFELNPDHLITKRLQAETDDAKFAELTHILFDQALLADGAKLDDPAAFVKRINQLLLEMALKP